VEQGFQKDKDMETKLRGFAYRWAVCCQTTRVFSRLAADWLAILAQNLV
jgi:hypothetical protein